MWPKIKEIFQPLLGIRGRLTLWYAFLMTLTILISSVFFYETLRFRLYNAVDHELEEEIVEYTDAAKNNIFSEKDIVPFTQRYFQKHVLRPGEIILVKTEQGKIITTSSQIQLEKIPENHSRLGSLQVKKEIFTLDVSEIGQIRIASVPIKLNGKTIGILQTAEPLTSIKKTLSDTFSLVLIGSLGGLVIVSVIGFFIAGNALSPIIKITQTAQKITQGDLKSRVRHQGPPDEVGTLAKTFNDMIEELDKTFREQKQFLSDASHELRTPLTIAKGNLEVLKRLLDSPNPEFKEMLNVTLDELDRMNRLVNSLLLLARSSQRDFLIMEEFSLKPFLEQIFKKAKSLASRQWSLEKIPSLTIKADRDKLTQSLLNLFQNAVEHTEEGDNIGLKAEVDRNLVKISVFDSGPGIPQDEQYRIFQRFYQTDKARSKESGDSGRSGLGLSIVEAIIKAHGGKIEVESVLGQGSTFTLWLPLSKRKSNERTA